MASVLKVDKLDPQSGTALEIGTSGDTISVPSGATLDISASTLTPPATMPASSAANLTNIPGANITGTIAAVSGANLTSLNATNLGSGTVPTARLGTGTASSSTVLYGDQTYKAEPTTTLKIKQIVYETAIGNQTMTSIDTTWNVITNPSPTITPTATDNKILIEFYLSNHMEHNAYRTCSYDFQRAISGGATTTRLAYTANGASTNGVGYQTNYVSGSQATNARWISCYGNRPYVWVDTTYNTTSAITYSGMAAPYSATAGSSWFMNSSWTTIMVLTEYE